MSEKRILLSYYKHRLYSGRTAFARAVDYAALRLILLLACYLWFTQSVQSIAMAAILSITSVTVISLGAELYKSIRLERFIDRERERLRGQLFREKLALMGKDEFLSLIREYIRAHGDDFAGDSLVYSAQSVSPLSEDAVLAACRAARRRGCSAVSIFSASPISAGASAFAGRYGAVAVSFVTPEMLTAQMKESAALPEDGEVDAYIMAKHHQRRRERKKMVSDPLGPNRALRYFLVAAGLFALSFFVKYTLYYRVLAGACLSLGALSYYLKQTASAAPRHTV